MWLRIKRILVSCFSVLAISWSIFFAFKIAEDQLIDDAWQGYVLCAIVFGCGCFMTYISIRGSDDDIKKTDLFP